MDQDNTMMHQESADGIRLVGDVVIQQHQVADNLPIVDQAVPVQGNKESAGALNQQDDAPHIEENPETIPVVTTGLKEYLKANPVGKEILREQKGREEQPLKKTTRNKLTRLVIKREKDWQLKDVPSEQQLETFRISTKRFKILAEEIVEIFKKESAKTYFSEFKIIGKNRIPTAGKLWDHFNYEKNRLKNVGLLKTRSEPLPQIEFVLLVETKDKLEWLANHLDPWPQVILYWGDTYDACQHQLKEGELTSAQYLASYAPLQFHRGSELIEYDFAVQFPNHRTINQQELKIIKNCILRKLEQERHKASTENQVYIQTLLFNVLSDDQATFLTFYLPPIVIDVQRIKKRKKVAENSEAAVAEPVLPKKLTFQERIETFILHSPVSGDLKSVVENLQKKLHDTKQTFHPILVAEGRLVDIKKFHIILNDQYYEKKNVS